MFVFAMTINVPKNYLLRFYLNGPKRGQPGKGNRVGKTPRNVFGFPV